MFNKTSGVSWVIPFTTTQGKENNSPVHVHFLAKEVPGLCKDSTLMIENMAPIPNNWLHPAAGKLNEEQLSRVLRALFIQVPVDKIFQISIDNFELRLAK